MQRHNRQIDRDMRDVAGDAVEDAAELRHLTGHPRQLSIGGVDGAMQDEQADARERQRRTASSAPPATPMIAATTDTALGDSRSRRAHPRDEIADAAIEVDVDELFDLVRLVGEGVSTPPTPGYLVRKIDVPERRRDAEMPVGHGVVMGEVILPQIAAETSRHPTAGG